MSKVAKAEGASVATMVQGQLYRVGITAKSEDETHRIDCVLVGHTVDDVRTRFPFVFDLAGFDTFRIDYIAKEPARSIVVRTVVERVPHSQPDAVIKRDAGSEGVFQKVADPGLRFDVHAKTTLYARTPELAVKKMAERILGGSERVKTAAIAIAPPSAFAAAKDQSMFKRATFVRG